MGTISISTTSLHPKKGEGVCRTRTETSHLLLRCSYGQDHIFTTSAEPTNRAHFSAQVQSAFGICSGSSDNWLHMGQNK